VFLAHSSLGISEYLPIAHETKVNFGNSISSIKIFRFSFPFYKEFSCALAILSILQSPKGKLAFIIA
jgi:hypothetical protein